VDLDRSLTLSRRHLLDPLLHPFALLIGSEQDTLTVTEKVLDDYIKSMFKVFVLGNDPMFLSQIRQAEHQLTVPRHAPAQPPRHRPRLL